MVGYGFAIASNPFDHYAVGLRVPPGSPLVETRSWNADRQDDDYKCYIFNIEHPRAISASCLEASIFSFDLLDSISVLSANDRELQTMFESKETYMSSRITRKKISDNRNLLHTFVQLHQECQARLRLLRATDPAARDPKYLTAPSAPNQQFAKIYRDSQTSILATAVALCRYILLRSRANGPSEGVLKMLRAAPELAETDTQSIRDLQTLVARHVSLIRSNELLGYSEIEGLLTLQSLEELRQVMQLTQSGLKDSQGSGHRDRSRLAMLVAAVCQFPKELPTSFATWLRKVKDWYPPDDPNWTTMPADDDGEEIKSLLESLAKFGDITITNGHSSVTGHTAKKWCTVEMLCWGWNVVGEESVRVPRGILPSRSSGGGEDGSDAELFLYIPSI